MCIPTARHAHSQNTQVCVCAIWYVGTTPPREKSQSTVQHRHVQFCHSWARKGVCVCLCCAPILARARKHQCAVAGVWYNASSERDKMTSQRPTVHRVPVILLFRKRLGCEMHPVSALGRASLSHDTGSSMAVIIELATVSLAGHSLMVCIVTKNVIAATFTQPMKGSCDKKR